MEAGPLAELGMGEQEPRPSWRKVYEMAGRAVGEKSAVCGGFVHVMFLAVGYIVSKKAKKAQCPSTLLCKIINKQTFKSKLVSTLFCSRLCMCYIFNLIVNIC